MNDIDINARKLAMVNKLEYKRKTELVKYFGKTHKRTMQI